jgi:site-specific recombinase XerC
MTKATTSPSVRNFHVPLPVALYKRLQKEAEERSVPATQLARRAIEAWLKTRERIRVAEGIRAYAVTAAGTDEDLDREMETASLAAPHWDDEE